MMQLPANARYAMVYLKLTLGLLLTFCLAANLHANDQDSDVLKTEYLKPVVGSRDSALGAQIVAVEQRKNSLRIEISLPPPKTAANTEILLEEMTVIGEPFANNLPEGSPEIKQVQQHEWINDIDRGEYGLVLYLPKSENFALHINYRNLSQERQSGLAPLSLEGDDKGR